MDTNQIIAQIDTEIAHLQAVKGILSGTTITKVKRGKKAKTAPKPVIVKKRTMSRRWENRCCSEGAVGEDEESCEIEF